VDQNVLNDIRHSIDSYVGHRVRIKANRGRRKIVTREGTLEKTYPNFFLVRLDENQQNRKISFQYADILTEIVELTVCDVEGDKEIRFTAS